MNERLKSQTIMLTEHGMEFLAGAPVVVHCHHFNLFLDQTIDDALGPEVGTKLRMLAAMEASHQLLSGLVQGLAVATADERLALAVETFAALGHGSLEIIADANGGKAHGQFLHYGFCWREKYGATVRRRHPADAFAAGYAAAAVTIAYDLPFGTIRPTEKNCYAMRHEQCEIILEAGGEPLTYDVCGIDETKQIIQGACDSSHEGAIAEMANSMRGLIATVSPDERGLIRAFGVFMARQLANYYNRLTAGAVAHVKKIAPRVLPVVEELLRESGHVCVFNTFGGVLLSPEWEGLVGPMTNDPVRVTQSCVAIARALGFGRWSVLEFEPGERLVLRSAVNYESGYCHHSTDRSVRGVSYFLQGSALAIMQLASTVDWDSTVELTHEFYLSLFKNQVPWKVKQTLCTVRGDSCDEVVVSRR